MIISHKHKYLFVELQRTASLAIRRELMQQYSGAEILRRHSIYPTFLKTATNEEKNYFVFSGIRNPLDRTISFYEKLRNDPRNYISNIRQKENKSLADRYFLDQHIFIKKNNATFSQYLRKFYFFPYDDRSCISHKTFDYVYRFENIQQDFAEILRRLNINQIRALPVFNKTKGKVSDLASYFDDKDKRLITRVFGPFMVKWKYRLPFDDVRITFVDQFYFKICGLVRCAYYRFVMAA